MPKLKNIEKKSIPRVVIDTNVLISGLLTPNGPSGKILSLLTEPNTFILLVTKEIFAEYSEVAHRNKFKFSKSKVENILKLILELSLTVYPQYKLKETNDVKDNKFLECALEGNASFVVTGNKKHFPFLEFRGVKILSPVEFLLLFNTS